MNESLKEKENPDAGRRIVNDIDRMVREKIKYDRQIKKYIKELSVEEMAGSRALKGELIVKEKIKAINLIYKNDIPPKVVKYLNTIKQNTNRQLRLVNNLLDNIRISAGNVTLNYSKFDIVFVTREIVKSVDLYSNQKKLSLDFYSSLRRKRVILDEEKYERILLNLLSNAFKFTPKGRTIGNWHSQGYASHRFRTLRTSGQCFIKKRGRYRPGSALCEADC